MLLETCILLLGAGLQQQCQPDLSSASAQGTPLLAPSRWMHVEECKGFHP